jgi:poly(A) polymerase
MPEAPALAPHVIPRAEHPISRAQISKHALHVLYGLHRAGYQACLVGGGVRDLLLGVTPKDFDVVTNARPEEVRAVFRNCRLIGRRFRLAHVHFGRDIVEVATYRAPGTGAEEPEEALTAGERIVRDNVYGTREDDVQRRDFTVNALYYDITDFSLVDYVGGMQDVRSRTLRMIGDPERRYREDPVRLLRAVRLAAKLGLAIEPATRAPIAALAPLLATVPGSRLFDELLKLLLSGNALRSYALLQEFGLLEYLFAVHADDRAAHATLIRLALESTDRRVAQGLPVTPAFLAAVLLWGPVSRELAARRASGEGEFLGWSHAVRAVLSAQNERVPIPRRFTLAAAELWTLQARMARKRRVTHLAGHPRLRAAYDFLLLRSQAAPEDAELAALATFWAGEVPAAGHRPHGEDAPLADQHARPPRGRRRGRRGGRRRRARGGEAAETAIGMSDVS